MTRTRRRAPVGVGAELLLTAVHLTVVVAFLRLFDDRSFLVPLMAMVAVSQIGAVFARRLRLGFATTLGLALLSGAITIVWTIFPETTSHGLPTGASIDALSESIRIARDSFDQVVAPTEPIDGFLVLLALALGFSVWFADWAAFRLQGLVEAIAPATILFFFTTLLGSGSHRVPTAVAFAATVLLFALLHRAASDPPTPRTDPDRSTVPGRTAFGSGLVLILVSLTVGAVLGPQLPGADDPPILRWRRQSSEPARRSTVSPMVSLKPRLVDQADTELFRVRADRPAYWRLTALDEFDGTIWRIDSSFTGASGALPRLDASSDPGAALDQEYEIEGLDDLWVPAALEATWVAASDGGLRWDRRSSTLIVDRDVDSVAGLRYSVTSRVPTPRPDQLRDADRPDPPDLDEFTRLPLDFPSEVTDLARSLTNGSDGRYEQMLALQNFFREEFRYSTEIPEGHDDNAILAFLDRRVGYCEQFAGTFAAMARALGVPARVGVGFTPGEEIPDEPGWYRVRGRHAHAWPEVFFDGIGWVPFEPTPGRGLEASEPYTGVPAQQDPGTGPGTDEPATTSTTEAPDDTAPAPDDPSGSVPDTPSETPAEPATDRERGGVPRLLLLGAVLIVIGASAAIVILLRRRRSGSRGGPASALSSWDLVARELERSTGLTRSPPETRSEYVTRIAATDLDPHLIEDLRRLAAHADEATWSDRGLTGEAGEDADRIASTLIDHLRGSRRPR